MDRPLTTLLVLLAAMLVLLGATLVAPTFASAADDPPATAPATPIEPRVTVTIGEETFRLRLAADDESRRRGLGGVERIDEHGGMIFVFPRARQRTFWMADCLVDMDVVFLDDDGRITAVHAMTKEPPRGDRESTWRYHARLKRYPSRRPARFAMEFRAGTARRLGLEPGGTITFDRQSLTRLAR